MIPDDTSTHPSSSPACRIGIYRTRYAGDILLLVPLLHKIRNGIPGAELFVIVNEGTQFPLTQLGIPFFPFRRESGLAKLNSVRDLGRVLERRTFDLWVDLTMSDRSKFFTRRVRSRIKVGAGWEGDSRPSDPYDLFFPYDYDHGPEHVTVFTESVFVGGGLELPPGIPDFSVPPDSVEQENVNRFFLEHNFQKKPFIVIHPGARNWFKRWPPDRFGRAASWWGKKTGGIAVIVGTKEETTLMESVEASMDPEVRRIVVQRSFPFLHALLARATLFIGNDSAPLHLAHSAGTPLIALFGSTTPKVWGPLSTAGSAVLYRPPACSPCTHTGCSMGRDNCLLQIPVEDVIETMEDIMKRKETISS
ncbi:MAG: glycosyltransferase family 9 protein [Leptospirillum sp.]